MGRGAVMVVAVAMGALSGAASAQPAAADVADLTAVEKRTADKGLSLREREQAVDRAVELRGKLIGAAPEDDARLTGWLIDQSSALLARLARDGSDSAVLFGIALPAQRAAVTAAAGEALKGLERGGVRVDEGSKRLAEASIPSDDPLAVRIEQDRTVRVPFFVARARVLLAACATGAERAHHAEAAYAAISKLALATAAPEAARRVNLGAALLMRKVPTDETDAQTALDEFAGAIKAEGTIPAITLAEAWAGMVHAGAAAGRLDQTMKGLELAQKQPPFVSAGRADPLLAVLLADATTRAMWERGVRMKERALLDRAVLVQTRLLEREDMGIRADSLRPLAFEKLGMLAEGAGNDVPPAVRLARAISLARSSGGREDAGRAEAVRAFKEVAGAKDAGEYSADALWEWAVLLSQGSDRVGAAEVLTRLAHEQPKSAHATDAMNAALAYARAGVVEGGGKSEARRVYERALVVATEEYPALDQIDLWRYERARLLSEPEGGAAPSEGDADKALALLVQASGTASATADRLRERVGAGILDRGFVRVAELRSAGVEAGAQSLARERLLPVARKMVEWASSRRSPMLERFKLDRADAIVEAGEKGAGADYKILSAHEADLPGGFVRVRLGWARALILEGDAAGAFGHLREVVTRLDTGEGRPREYWFAWMLMLELLQEENKQGDRSGTIRAHIKRLEGIDAELGGEPWKARIGKVREAVGE